MMCAVIKQLISDKIIPISVCISKIIAIPMQLCAVKVVPCLRAAPFLILAWFRSPHFSLLRAFSTL